MAADKISELVDQAAFAQLDKLIQKVEGAQAALLAAVDTATQFNNALGRSATSRDFVDNQTRAARAISDTTREYERQRIADLNLQRQREQAFDRYEQRLQREQQAQDRAEANRVRNEQSEQRRDQQAQARATRERSRNSENIQAYQLLRLTYEEASKAAQNIGVAFGANSTQFTAAATRVNELRAQLDAVDNRLGRFQRNVGNYASAFNGLGNSVQQVARELPALGINIQTFFLAISNNLPILFDEIMKINVANRTAAAEAQLAATAAAEQAAAAAVAAGATQAEAAAQSELAAATALANAQLGRQTVGQALLRSIFSLQTALVVGVTLLVLYGKEIAKFTRELFNGADSVDTYKESLKNLNEAYKQADRDAGQQATNLRILYAAATDVTNATDKRLKAAQELQKEFPNTFKNERLLAIINGESKLSYEELTKSILDNAKAKAAATKITELSAKQLDAEFQIQKIRNAQVSETARLQKDIASGKFDVEGGGILEGDQQKKINQRAANAIKIQEQYRKFYRDQIAFYTKFAGGNNNLADVLSGGAGAGDTNAINATLQEENLKRTIDTNKLIADDEKRSYAARRIALKQLLEDQSTLIKNKEALDLQTAGTEAERVQVSIRTTSELLSAQTDYNTRLKQLNEAAANDLFEVNRLKIDKQKAAAKAIVDDESQSYEVRLQALEKYVKRAKSAIELQAKNEIELAGANGNKVKQAQIKRANELSTLATDTQNTQDKILQAGYERQFSAAQTRDKKLLEQLKSGNQARIAEVITNRDAAINSLIEQFEKGIITEKQYSEQRKNIEFQSSQDILTINIDALKKLIELKKAAGLETADDEKSVNDLQLKYTDTIEGERINTAKTAYEQRKELHELELQLGQEALQAAQSISQGIFDARISAIEKEKAALEEQTQYEKDRAERSIGTSRQKAKQQKLIDEQAAVRQRQLDEQIAEQKKKAAIAEKIAAIASIVISTQVAAAKVIGQTGLFGLPLQALIYAQGAIQVATVLAQPLPEFAKGGTTKGGKLIWGEKGTELAVQPDGSTYLSPSRATVTEMPAGTRIFNNTETMRMMAKPERMQHVGGVTVDMDKVVKSQDRTTAAIERLASRNGNTGRGVVRSGLSNDYLRRNKI